MPYRNIQAKRAADRRYRRKRHALEHIGAWPPGFAASRPVNPNSPAPARSSSGRRWLWWIIGAAALLFGPLLIPAKSTVPGPSE
jgi:hypothetical protein